MKRRKALQISSGILGYSLAGGSLAALLNGCKADPKIEWIPKFFNEDQMKLLTILVEMIIPRTDTPGANDALVERYVDEAVADYFTEQEREHFLAAVYYVDEVSNTMFRKRFADSTEENRIETLEILCDQATQRRGHAFNNIRDLVISGFFSSEIGATQVLHYDPVPGPFKGCVNLDEVGGVCSGI